MSPLEFLQRLAALIPRPQLHLIRFHGVLAPNAALRSQIVPGEADQAPNTAAGDGDRVHDVKVRWEAFFAHGVGSAFFLVSNLTVYKTARKEAAQCEMTCKNLRLNEKC